MKIAVFSWETLHSKAVGGIAPHVTELAAALQRRGNEVHIFTQCAGGEIGYENIFGVHYHRVGFSQEGSLIQKMEAMCNAMAWAFGETNNYIHGFDVACAHDWMCAKALVQVKNSHGVPTVFTFHSTEKGRTLGQPNGKIMEFEAEAGFVADRIIAVSPRLKEEIIHNYNVPASKIWDIFNGIQCSNYDGFVDCGEVKGRYGIGCMDPVLLFVGRMTGGLKGADLIVEAMPEILGFNGDIKAVFVGDGDAKMHCDHRAKELGVAHATRFLGTKNGQELIDLYKACDAVCVPSRNEPFGLTVLEAWAAGKPVIASDQVGCPVTDGVEGRVVSCSPEGVAWGVKELFGNFDRAREWGKNGRVKAAFSFSWDTVAEKTEECYRDIIHYKRG
jgi:glycosyltransferase involved in cell wall biosynthesis